MPEQMPLILASVSAALLLILLVFFLLQMAQQRRQQASLKARLEQSEELVCEYMERLARDSELRLFTSIGQDQASTQQLLLAQQAQDAARADRLDQRLDASLSS